LGARDAWQTRCFTPHGFGGQPSKGGGFHLQWGQTPLLTAHHLHTGQVMGQSRHQLQIQSPAATHNQLYRTVGVTPHIMRAGQSRELG
jgi:hypothetical protein